MTNLEMEKALSLMRSIYFLRKKQINTPSNMVWGILGEKGWFLSINNSPEDWQDSTHQLFEDKLIEEPNQFYFSLFHTNHHHCNIKDLSRQLRNYYDPVWLDWDIEIEYNEEDNSFSYFYNIAYRCHESNYLRYPEVSYAPTPVISTKHKYMFKKLLCWIKHLFPNYIRNMEDFLIEHI